jgi:hypothetical protein
LVILVFGREVSRSAHQENSARLSENLSFSSVAGTLLTQENSFDTQLATLLTTGSHLTRPQFAVQLSELTQEVSAWRNVAGLMMTPVLSPNLNVTLSQATVIRVTDYDTMLAYVAQALSLSGPTTSNSAPTLGAAQLSLSATAASWGSQRHQLSGAPGSVTLSALTNVSGKLNVPQDVATLASAPNLAATRAIMISAIQIQPAPFPAPALTLLLAPTTSMLVQVAVSNLREIAQPVSLSLVLTSASGAVQQVTMTHTLAPSTSFAFVSHSFMVHSGEKGTFSVTLNGLPAAPGLRHSRTYALSVSPTGAG